MSLLPGPTELEHIARIVHEAVRAYAVTKGDKSYLPWDSCPDNIKNKVKEDILFLIRNESKPEPQRLSWLALGYKDRLCYFIIKSMTPHIGEWSGE